MARTKSAAEPVIVAEAAPEQFTLNTDTPQETPPAPDLTDAEAVTLAHEGEAALFEMGEVLPDPGELNVPVPDAPDTVIPFEDISGKAQEQEKSEQEPEQQPPEQGEQPKPEVEKADKPDADKAPAQEAKKPGKTKAAKADKAPAKEPKPEKQPKAEKAPKAPTAAKEAAAPAQEETPAPPPEPKEAPRAGETEQIVYLNLSELHAFKDHPFQVRDDEEMRAMVESVKDKGVTQPAIVRPREDGGYEVVSGHRRMKASDLAGFANMPCIVRNLTDEQAITQMVEDNTNQRENILPSERAKALKMQLEAIKRQGARGDLGTSGQDGPKLENGQRSNQIVAERNKMAVKQVQRYIKLNDLVPDLMKLVDEKKIAFTPAVEMSYIRPKNQRHIAVAIEGQQSAPSLSQAQRMRELDQKNMLNGDVIDGIMLEEKKEVDKVIISSQELGQYFGKDKTPREMKDQILKLLDEWKEKQPQDLAKAEKKTEQEK